MRTQIYIALLLGHSMLAACTRTTDDLTIACARGDQCFVCSSRADRICTDCVGGTLLCSPTSNQVGNRCFFGSHVPCPPGLGTDSGLPPGDAALLIADAEAQRDDASGPSKPADAGADPLCGVP